MEISASPIHTQSLSRSGTTGINGSERQRPFHKSIHKTTAVAVGRETGEDGGGRGGLFGSPSVERVFYFVSLSLCFILIFILIGTT